MQGTVFRTAALALGLLAAAPARVALAGGRREPVPDERIALEVLVMDGSTGATVRGAKVAFRLTEGAEPQPLVAQGGVHRLETTGLKGGEALSYLLDLELPPGWVQERVSDYEPNLPKASIFTRTIVRTLVVWPEARIRVTVVDAAGAPVPGASLSGRRPAARHSLSDNGWHSSRQPAAPDASGLGGGSTGADGTGFLKGIPAIAGLTLKAAADGEDRGGESETFQIGGPRDLVDVLVRLPPEPGWTGIGGGGGGMYG